MAKEDKLPYENLFSTPINLAGGSIAFIFSNKIIIFSIVGGEGYFASGRSAGGVAKAICGGLSRSKGCFLGIIPGFGFA